MLHETAEVKLVLNELKKHLFDFAILGGYPRDIAHNKEPKDLDICVFNFHDNDMAEQKLLQMFMNSIQPLVKKIHGVSHPSAEGDDRVHIVISLECDVDIIIWNAATKREVIDKFDFNINQYELEISDIGEATTYYHGNNRGELRMIRNLHEYSSKAVERTLYMCEKADSLGWDVCLERNNLKLQMRKM